MLEVRLRRAYEPEDVSPRPCGMCGAGFRPEAVLAEANIPNEWTEHSAVCEVCLSHLARRAEQEPIPAGWHEAYRRYVKAASEYAEPLFPSVEAVLEAERTDPEGTAAVLAGASLEPTTAPGEERRCFVRHKDAGGQCERPARVVVYDLNFCEIHGAEANAGARIESCQDSADFLERLDNPSVPAPNPAALRALRSAINGLEAAVAEAQEVEDAALPRAYPWIEERVDLETRGFDWSNPEGDVTPDMVFWRARQLVYKLMRLAHAEEADWLVEALEPHRESVSAQYAFALEDCKRKTGHRI